MPIEKVLTVSYQQPTFQIDLTPVDVTLQFNAAGAGPIGPPGATGPPGVGIIGPIGPAGPQGLPGVGASIGVGSTYSLAAGSQATVTNSGSSNAAVLNFGIPAGANGQDGAAATLSVGMTGTGLPGTAAIVTERGTASARIFDFVIPAGQIGAQGPPGQSLTIKGSVATSANLPTTGNTAGDLWLTADGNGWVWNDTPVPGGWTSIGAILGPQGVPGVPGTAATVTVGNTTTGAPGTAAQVNGRGTPQDLILDFAIPAGDIGAQGPAGAAATIAAGNTTTVSPNASALVTQRGTPQNAIFDFEIPQGATGAQGPPGNGDMNKSVYDTTNAGIVDKAAVANSVAWSGVTGAPASFPSDWNTVANRPTSFPATPHAATHNLGGSDPVAPDWTQVQNKPVSYPVDWSSVQNKPLAFPATPHASTHNLGGSDAIAPDWTQVQNKVSADSTRAGLLNTLTGRTTDYVTGNNTCSDLAAAVAAVVGTVPTGTVVDFAGLTAPTGWLLCDGVSYSRTLYPGLFGVIGTTYGSSSGTTFNVPDCRGRSAIGVGQGTGLTNRTLAVTGGEENHVLTTGELATHAHGMDHNHTIPAGQFSHYHPIPPVGYFYYNMGSGGVYANWLASSGAVYFAATNTTTLGGGDTSWASQTNSAWVNTGSTGSNTGHNTMSPFIAFNKIIKT